MLKDRAWLPGIGFLLGVLACAGDPFFYDPPEDEPLSEANQLDSSDNPEMPSDISNPVVDPPPVVDETDPVVASPCGPLRTRDPALEDGEVCFASSVFTMGSDEPNFDQGYVVHGPAHEVSLSAYVLGSHEVTVARFRLCVEAGGCDVPSDAYEQGCTYVDFSSSQDLAPITCVSHQQAADFCAWDGGRSLPTEAQWERAARGLDSTDYTWSGDFRCSLAVLGSRSTCTQYEAPIPRTVGSAPDGATAEGIHDLIGNAAEWVADWGGGYSRRPSQDPVGPESGSLRVHKGGGWRTQLAKSVAYARGVTDPASTSAFSFRCARPAQP